MNFSIKNILLLVLFAVAFLAPPNFAFGKQPPPPPNPPRLVNDYTGTLNQNEIAALERKLVAYDDSTSTQIAIVMESTLEGDDIFDYSYRLASEWGIGREGKSNGILIYVALSDRRLYIQTGYGAEGFLPDALARRIIDNVIAPNFKAGRYYAGFDQATDVIIKLGNGEYQNDQVYQDDFPWGFLVILAIFILIIILINRGGGGGYYRGGRYDSDRGGWIIMGPGRGVGGGGWPSGGGGFGGGGFGGFGGGGFGGGGAGGSW